MIGWHYTTVEHWETIRLIGLRPRPFAGCGKELIEEDTGIANGIFVFTEPLLTPHELVGQLMFTATAHRSWNVAALEVNYDPETQITRHRDGYRWSCTHQGDFTRRGEPWTYHENKPMAVLAARVPHHRVRLVQTWAIDTLLAAAGIPQ